MNVAYSFIGELPHYAVDTVYQMRLFYDGPIYFIISDYTSEYVNELVNKYNVVIIRYDEVASTLFNDTYHNTSHKFCIVNELKGREKLFVHAFERFFVLYECMKKYNIENVFFLELDNLIYDDPRNWYTLFSKKELCYMIDSIGRASSGICYIHSHINLLHLLQFFVDFMNNSKSFKSEMHALFDYVVENRDRVLLLPTHWPSENIPDIFYDNYQDTHDSIFDAAAIGIYLGGMDPFHTNNNITKGLHNPYSFINYTSYSFEWKEDDKHRKIPYVYSRELQKWIRINNLHVHSKDLKGCFSIAN